MQQRACSPYSSDSGGNLLPSLGPNLGGELWTHDLCRALSAFSWPADIRERDFLALFKKKRLLYRNLKEGIFPCLHTFYKKKLRVGEIQKQILDERKT